MVYPNDAVLNLERAVKPVQVGRRTRISINADRLPGAVVIAWKVCSYS